METERLLIDPLHKSDKLDYFNCISHDQEVLKTFICSYEESLESFDFDRIMKIEHLFAVRLKETGRLIGIVLAFDVDKENKRCEIGYGFGSGFWGHGYATEAVGRFIKYLFEEEGFQTVLASYFKGNIASEKVMKKCGMEFHHLAEKELIYQNEEKDLVYYCIKK